MALDLATFLPYRLANLASKMSEEFANVYQQQSDLTIPQWRILFNLAQFGQSHAKALCEQAAMDKSTVSRAIKALIDKRYVLSLENPQDKRANLLALSDEGHSLYQQLAPAALAWEQDLLASLTQDEYTVLLSCLNKLQTKLEA
ncbi:MULTISPECIES: MarR family transcriptional regulator [unclassified Pseudoalteromonas]|uniref:MarR family winged helix-turn-helix transcriptional regulator n=1 Tax=unclassified Pseudoalteromonas TaxID=194690 RepID=UPI000C06CF81|nr:MULTISPECIES: MarR family transcriptional regulator [unclassified Pseudoalteromonas]MDP2635618.1 MarR family transcriptional regulator [Pseudoalteromonas sp. 1_MG-2023]PHN88891.1 MarR family transcriptional regulator [Pseudoalteromonas sp. 3D05]